MTFVSSLAPLARQVSVRAIIEAVLRTGSASRAELARMTGLSKQTASEVVRALEQEGWLRARGSTQGPVGRSAVAYELQGDAAFVLGADLGGTKLHIAIANIVGAIVAEEAAPTDRRGGLHVIAQIGAMRDRLVAGAGLAKDAVRYAALGSPGVFDPRTGRILIAPNIPDFDAIDVQAALREQLGCDAVIENDVNLAAKGEHWQGRSASAQCFAFIALGTGIGMGVLLNGEPLRGARGAAGEIAYLPLGGDPFDSRTSRVGTLESAVASAAILDRYRGFGGEDASDVRGVFDRLALGDAAAEATLDETARLLLQAIMAVRAVIDPEKIVLGGSIGARPELLERVTRLAARYMPDGPAIESSALGSRAALIGAIGAGLGALHDRLFGVTGGAPELSLPTRA